MDKYFNLGISSEMLKKLDFIIIPTTHLHMTDFTMDACDSALERRAVLYVQRFHKLLQKDLPMILFMHVPLYSEETYQFIWDFQRAENFPENASAGLMGVPPERMAHYTKECYKQQASHPYTDEAFAYIKNEPLIKAVVTGHIHKDFECMIDGHLQQIVTDRESVREIYID